MLFQLLVKFTVKLAILFHVQEEEKRKNSPRDATRKKHFHHNCNVENSISILALNACRTSSKYKMIQIFRVDPL